MALLTAKVTAEIFFHKFERNECMNSAIALE